MCFRKIFLLTLMCFIANFIHAHDGSYEMNYENFIAHNQGFTTTNAVLTAKVVKKDTYSELLFYNEDGGKVNFEFNNHFSRSKDYNKHFSVSTFGWYNTISYKSADIAYLWHGTPYMLRSNDGFGTIDRKFFENIIATGSFEYLIEHNWRYFYYNAVANSAEFSTDDFPNMPPSIRVFKVIVQLTNPEIIKEFFHNYNK